MKYTIIILCLLVTAWVIHLKMQMRSLSRQLEKRLSDGSRNSIHTALLDPSAIRLAADINRCLEEDEKKRQTLEREEKQFRDTIANISHDLRTPLTSVKGYMQLLEKTLTQPQQLERVGAAGVKLDGAIALFVGALVFAKFEPNSPDAYSCVDGTGLQLERALIRLKGVVEIAFFKGLFRGRAHGLGQAASVFGGVERDLSALALFAAARVLALGRFV